MTEREYYRKPISEPTRREVYQKTEVDLDGVPSEARHDIYQERTVGSNGDAVVRSERVSVPSEAAQRAAGVERTKQIVYFVFGALETLLAIRFVLLLLGANPDSGFVNLIYGLSYPFVLPFQGIFGEPTFSGSVLEWASLVGIVVYLIVAYGVARIVELVAAPPRADRTHGI
jgi:hypothetical protein